MELEKCSRPFMATLLFSISLIGHSGPVISEHIVLTLNWLDCVQKVGKSMLVILLLFTSEYFYSSMKIVFLLFKCKIFV